jgi:rhodanese-related sulfurtransferase
MTLSELTRRAIRRAGLPLHRRPAPASPPRRTSGAGRPPVTTENGYAGDVSPTTAWEILRDDPTAKLVDVRPELEAHAVGQPDLGRLGKTVLTVPWQGDPSFVHEAAAAGVRPEDTVLLLCRSGVRSAAAAQALSARGFQRCYNVAEGFEGNRDADGRRGTETGWKLRDLPWVQD